MGAPKKADKSEIYKYIKKEYKKTGYFPTITKISNEFDMSKSTVFVRIEKLLFDNKIIKNENGRYRLPKAVMYKLLKNSLRK